MSSRNAPPHLWEGALRDDTKTRCVADWFGPRQMQVLPVMFICVVGHSLNYGVINNCVTSLSHFFPVTFSVKVVAFQINQLFTCMR